MREAEHKALLRAATLLLAVSLVRWGTAVVHPDGPNAGGTDPLGELARHQAATDAAVSEATRRARPLGDGERLDPNTADEVDLDRLPGVGPSTARAIRAARDSGVVFRRTEDLLAVRGIGPASLQRIQAHLTLPDGRRSAVTPARRRVMSRSVGSPPRKATTGAPASGPSGRAERCGVNRAGRGARECARGIGPALATRIVEEREGRPFESVDDLVRVRGIGPSTVERLRPHARVGRRR